MKFLLIPLLLAGITGRAQNEFANEKFYSAFRQVVADGENGFATNRGAQQRTAMDGLVKKFRLRSLLPLADSGSLYFPVIGRPYAEFYFRSGKTQAEIDQRKANLVQAVSNALNKTLYPRTETSTLKGYTFRTTYYYSNPRDSLSIFADFKASTYVEKGKYLLTFEVIGKPPKVEIVKKSALSAEPDLKGKIEAFFSDALSCFQSQKSKQLRSNQYNTYYETRATLFGQPGEVEESKLECTLNYAFGFTVFSGLDEAEKIYGQLRSQLESSLGVRISFRSEEQSKYNRESYSVQGFDAGSNFINTKNMVTLTIVRSKDFPAVYLRFNRKKY